MTLVKEVIENLIVNNKTMKVYLFCDRLIRGKGGLFRMAL